MKLLIFLILLYPSIVDAPILWKYQFMGIEWKESCVVNWKNEVVSEEEALGSGFIEPCTKFIGIPIYKLIYLE